MLEVSKEGSSQILVARLISEQDVQPIGLERDTLIGRIVFSSVTETRDRGQCVKEPFGVRLRQGALGIDRMEVDLQQADPSTAEGQSNLLEQSIVRLPGRVPLEG